MFSQWSTCSKLAVAVAALVLTFCGASVAQADVVIGETFESGAAGWTMSGLWHLKDHPETVAVSSDINPGLVTLPDSGQLPAAANGTHAAWYGEDASGTYCAGYTSVTQTPKDGCTTPGSNNGRLVSPSFSLVGATTAQVVFSAWWEIEAVEANDFDLMKVQYSTDDGATWQDLGELNPINNPNGADDQSYSNNGQEVSPSWRSYVADLSAAAGQGNVRIGFLFDTVDELFNGFRGLLIDDVSISTPFTEGAPVIAGLDPTCVSSSATNQVVAVSGQHFVLGSKLELDGTEVPGAATLSSTRMEFTVSNLTAGDHTVQVFNPHGDGSNLATLKSAADCAPPPPPPSSPSGGGGSTQSRGTATQVICNRGPDPLDNSVCTATVGDADAPPRTTPTGPVSFTTTTGIFTVGSTCQLQETPSSPGVASCSVTYTPQAPGVFPLVTATYQGDATHRPSTGSTSFIIAAPPPPEGNAATNPADCPGILAGAARRAKVRIDNEAASVPESQRGVGFCLYYGADTLLHQGVSGVFQLGVGITGVVVGVGLPVGAAVVGGTEAGPLGAVGGLGLGAAIDKQYIVPWTGGLIGWTREAEQRALKDPPDPKFKVVVTPRRTKVPRLRAGGGLDSRTAASLTRLVREMARAQDLARAISATIDKAGGAKAAGDAKWVGIQTRTYLGYAKRLTASLDRLVELQRAAATLARHSRILSTPSITRRQVAKNLKEKARRGFSKSERRLLHRWLGLTPAQIEQVRKWLGTVDPARVPRTVADLLGQRATIEAFKTASAAFKALAKVPSVVRDSKAGG